MSDPPAPPHSTPYRVLARTYRPASFADLIGQDAVVRTLTNAIESGRIAHAYILTGVRGVGKTTTARIIARALNCVGADGAGGPTAAPCGTCDNCVAIAEDRHVDVIEMDAASRTGIDDIRELIEGVRYRPVQARMKVYIIDEVHMLSKQAFNGLLKTLEEPPEHVVFIFATTEIRKVPVTVLSRCQRFDLRRVDQALLTEHFAGIAQREGIDVDDEALGMIARAADGSVRDGLSLLDQAIALSAGQKVEGEAVRAMLGLADRTRIFDLFEAVVTGRAPDALALIGELDAGGADPAVVLQDLLDLTHLLTRAKLVPETLTAPGLPEAERVRGQALSEQLPLPALARLWQMLLKGLGEVQVAPSRLRAAEMVLIRLVYAGDMPTPAELVARLRGEASAPGTGAPPPPRAVAASEPPARGTVAQARDIPRAESRPETGPRAALATRPEFDPPPEPEPDPAAAPPRPASFAEVVALARDRRETILANHLSNDVNLVSFEPGRIELKLGEHAPRNLPGHLMELLQTQTGERWVVSISDNQGAPTLRDQARAEAARQRDSALEHPFVQAAMDTFPGAELVDLRASRGTADADEDSGDGDDGV